MIWILSIYLICKANVCQGIYNPPTLGIFPTQAACEAELKSGSWAHFEWEDATRKAMAACSARPIGGPP